MKTGTMRPLWAVAIAAVGLLAIQPSIFQAGQKPATAFSSTPSLPRLQIQQPQSYEVGYLHSMMLHHDQAITLSMIAEEGGELPEVKRVARAITLNQLHEIGQMRGWLSAWGHFQAGKGQAMDWVKAVTAKNYIDELYISRCAANDNRMPGYFLPAQIEQLRQAKGLDKDKLFLEMMLKHHDEAVQMSNFAYNHAQTGLIKGLTRSIVVDQGLEMAHFKKILESLDF